MPSSKAPEVQINGLILQYSSSAVKFTDLFYMATVTGPNMATVTGPYGLILHPCRITKESHPIFWEKLFQVPSKMILDCFEGEIRDSIKEIEGASGASKRFNKGFFDTSVGSA